MDGAPEQAGQGPLAELARILASEEAVVSEHLLALVDGPGLGELAAAGPRTGERGGEYAFVIEAVREGFLLHHGRPRLLSAADPDLALLAGDYLYALGLERLSELDDPEAVRLLADLISLCALCRAQGLDACLDPLWLAFTVAIGCGESAQLKASVQALKRLDTAVEQGLLEAAEITAERSGIGEAVRVAAKAIHFPRVKEPKRV